MLREQLNRNVPPPAGPLHKVSFPEILERELSNGIPVYLVPYGTQEVIELRLLNSCGKSFEPKAAIASLTSQMLLEGTASYSGLEFALALDNYGAILRPGRGLEFGYLDLTTLSKHIRPTLELMFEAACKPSFPEQEFDKLVKRTVQTLSMEEKKTAYIARREFGRLLFGENHPYGSIVDKDAIKSVGHAELLDFHRNAFDAANLAIVAAGGFNEIELLKHLEDVFGGLQPNDERKMTSLADNAEVNTNSGAFNFPMADAMQATLRIGHIGFKRSHEDFYGMQVVNTILGDYFGSRLMSNIREEKGYTYGIGSAWISLKHGGFFIIQTNVGIEYVEPAQEEIIKELRKLIDEGTNEEELQLVKNYMMGRMISGRETPSQITDAVANFVVNDIDFALLDRKYELIEAVTPDDVNRLSSQWFKPDQLLQVIAGRT